MKYHSENFSGTLDFRSKIHQNWLVELHLHEYSEILYCEQGEGDIFINGQNIRLKAGEFIWIEPNCIHQYSFQNAKLVCAVFSNDFIPLYFSQTNGKKLIVSPILAEELKDILGSLHLLKKEQKLKICSYLNLIADKVIINSNYQEANSFDGILFQKVVSYLSTHFTEDIKLSKLASLFGYNEKYLSHALHSLSGIHYSQLLSLYRIEHAKKLLSQQPQKTITDVALECGFSAINTFHRVFLKHTQMTPMKYRNTFK